MIRSSRQTVFDPVYGYDEQESAWRAPKYVPADISAAARQQLADEALRPATFDEMQRELASLALRCKLNGEEEQFRMRVALYTQDLADVPFHVLRRAAQLHARRSKWFPSVSELLECAREVDPETMIVSGRLNAIARAPEDRFPVLPNIEFRRLPG